MVMEDRGVVVSTSWFGVFSCNTLVRTRDVSLSVVHNAEIAAGAAINFLESCASRRKSEFFGVR